MERWHMQRLFVVIAIAAVLVLPGVRAEGSPAPPSGQAADPAASDHAAPPAADPGSSTSASTTADPGYGCRPMCYDT